MLYNTGHLALSVLTFFEKNKEDFEFVGEQEVSPNQGKDSDFRQELTLSDRVGKDTEKSNPGKGNASSFLDPFTTN